MATYWNDGTELYHHGIPGMKWGVRNGPPYPLGTEQKTKAEKNESYRDKVYKEKLDKARDYLSSSKFKRLAKVGLAAVALYVTYKYATDSGNNLGRVVNIFKEWSKTDNTFTDMDAMHDAIKKVDTEYFDDVFVSEFSKNHAEEWKVLQDSFGKDDELYKNTLAELFGTKDYYNEFFNTPGYSDEMWEKLVKDLNPGWPKSKEISNNCMMCTDALVMRMKGYDTQAALTGMGWHDDMLSSWWGDDIVTRTFTSGVTKDDVISAILGEGNNHYGNFTVQWEPAGGHSIFYAVKNGEVHFIDGQVGREYNTDQLFKHINISACTFTDLTNATPQPRMAAGVLNKADRANAKIKPNTMIGFKAELTNFVKQDPDAFRNDILNKDTRFKNPSNSGLKVNMDEMNKQIEEIMDKMFNDLYHL